MLSKPDAGWTGFCLGSRTYYLSYLDDILLEWLNQAIHGLKTMSPFAVHGFCEPGRVLCLVSYWNCHIIFEDDDRKELISSETQWEFAHVNMLNFCKVLYADISQNLDAWSEWVNIFAETEREYNKVKQKRKKLLEKKLSELEKLIQKNENNFDEHHGFL